MMTVVRVTRLKDWKIMPMRRRNARRLLPCSCITSVPSTVSVPFVMSCMRLMVRIRVDLPAPDRPMMATNSPCPMVRLMSFSASKPLGYCFVYMFEFNHLINLTLSKKGGSAQLSLPFLHYTLSDRFRGTQAAMFRAWIIFWAARSES